MLIKKLCCFVCFLLLSFIAAVCLKKMLFVKKNINDEGRIYRKECYPLSRSHSS